MSESKKSIYNIVSGLIGQVVVITVGLVVPRLILVYFGSETNGLLNSIVQIFQYVYLLEAGVGMVTLQVLYGRLAQNDHQGINSCLSATVYYYRRIGWLYLAAMLGFSLIYPRIFHSEIPPIEITWIIIFSGLNSTISFFTMGHYRLLLEADGRKYVLNNINTIITLIANLLKIWLIVNGYSVLVVQAGFCVISTAQLVAVYLYSKAQYQWIDCLAVPDFKAMSQRYSALTHQLSGLIFGSTDMILLTIMCDLKVVSVYATYNLVATMVANLLSQISGGISYKLGQLYQTDKDKFLIWYHAFEIINFVLVFSAFSVVYVCMIPFVSLYTKGIVDINYLDTKLPFLFAMVQLLSGGRVAAGNVINYAGHFKKTEKRSILESVINLTFSIFGIYFFGIYGALLGTIIALFYRTNDIIWYTSKKLLNINPWYTYRRWLSCGGVFAIIVVFNYNFPLLVDDYMGLLVRGIGFCGVFLFVYAAVQLLLERRMIIRWFDLLKKY